VISNTTGREVPGLLINYVRKRPPPDAHHPWGATPPRRTGRPRPRR